MSIMCIDTLRCARPSDAAAIAELVNAAYRPGNNSAGWTHESELIDGGRISAGQVAEIMARPDSIIWLGLRGTAISACVHVEKDGDHSRIGMLAVHPELQGAGAGTRMLSHAEQHADAVWSSRKFLMTVLSSRTELVSFYLRRGYRKTGAVMDYPLSAGTGTPRQAGLRIETLEKSATPYAIRIDHP